ncbi:MAG: peptidoglycan DD-metalloendopeptidase family protein, partial [Bacteroidota bacterium]
MKKIILFFVFAVIVQFASAQVFEDQAIANNFASFNENNSFFEEAYKQYPEVPRGVLEAIAFTNTRFHHITHEEGEAHSCIGLPKAYGIMGLTLDGKDIFRNNLVTISQLSGYTIEEIIESPEKNILAYAKAYSVLKKQAGITNNSIEAQVPVLVELSELPVSSERSEITIGQDFALNAHIYTVLDFLNKPQNQTLYNIPQRNIDFINVFGQENYNVLSASSVVVSEEGVSNRSGDTYTGGKLAGMMSPDYGPALWVAACPNNYDVGRSMAVTAIAIHQQDGTYAGTISWFASCNNPYYTSSEYVLRSSDGQITQMVLESNTAHHVYTENSYTIGLEHEGYILQDGWYTTATYNASSALVRNICARKGISPLTCWYGISCKGNYTSCLVDQCIRIKGHNQFPNGGHTDPGVYWDWKRYYLLLNPMPSVTPLTAASGTTYDSGGQSGNYANAERRFTLISPTGASKVTLTFSSFNMEANADHILIYNGSTTAAPLIGKYTGTIPPATINSTGGSLLIEFRSDCSVVSSGWVANWTSNGSTTPPPPPAAVYKLPYPNGATYTCTQGNGGSTSHTGIPHYAFDIGMPINSSVCAARAGTVSHVVESFVDFNNTGNCNDVNRVVVDHGDGTSALYLHLTQNGALVNVGDKVTQGQIIAKSGSSGCSTGAHLHFQVMNAGTYGSWYNQSIAVKFCDVSTNNGVPVSGSSYTASPCGSTPPPSDVTAPTTSISTPNGFVTQNFTATFTDADNTGGSGLKKSFYHV